MADLVERADDDITRLLAQLVEAHPGKALRVLLETGALEQCGWLGESPIGNGTSLYWLDESNADMPDCVPVYRLADEEST